MIVFKNNKMHLNNFLLRNVLKNLTFRKTCLDYLSIYKSKRFITVSCKDEIASTIAETLQCNLKDANILVQGNKQMFTDNYQLAIESLKKLKHLGVNVQFIQRNSDLLLIPSEIFEERLSFINKLTTDANMNIFLNILKMSPGDFQIVSTLASKNKKKITELANLFQCSTEEACMYFVKYRFLLRSKITTLQGKVDLIVKGGVLLSDLNRDLWILTYTTAKLKTRIELLKSIKLAPIKTWMLRCNENVIQRSKTLREENRLAMAPYTSITAYLCKRLNISEEQVAIFATRHPPVMRVQVSKLKVVIDYLFSEGFNENQIYLTPRIFCHSLTTTQERLSALKERKYRPLSLSILCKSNKNFSLFLYKLELHEMQNL